MNVLIGGMGNVLLGDDGFGPYVIHRLEAEYDFGGEVELADLGTPALDLTHRIAGRDVVILIDCIQGNEHPAGTVLAYDKAELLKVVPVQRLDPHSPAVSECLMAAEMLGATPKHLLLLGAVGGSFDPGSPLGIALRAATDKVIATVIAELKLLGVWFRKKASSGEVPIWWQVSSQEQRSATE